MYLNILQRSALVIWMLISHGLMPIMNGQDRVSRNNYTGGWESPYSWDPEWTDPQTTYSGINVTINGYITANGPLTLYGNPTQLIINDTLVVKGDLTLGNNNNLIVNDNAILIIRGNLVFHDNSGITGNGYIIVTGNLVKTGKDLYGSFTSNDDPVKLFVGGSVPGEADGHPDYLVLNCSNPPTEPYSNSGCSYGNMADLMNDPVFDFFQSTCLLVKITGNGPVCSGNTVDLSISGGVAWEWNGPEGFTSNEQHPSIPGAGTGMTGVYTVMVTAASGCTVIASVEVFVSPHPRVVVTNPPPLCEPETVNLIDPAVTVGSDPDLAWSWHTDPEGSEDLPTPGEAGEGTWYIRGTSDIGCYSIKPVTVTVNPRPLVVVTNPPPICEPETTDLTDPAITGGSDPDLAWSWHTDPEGTDDLPAPHEAGAGTWYTRGTSDYGCYSIKPVTVTVNPLPAVVITDPSPLCGPETADLTDPAITGGSDPDLAWSWHTDPEGTDDLSAPRVAGEGTWYIRGTSDSGCYSVKPVTVTVKPLPEVGIMSSESRLCIDGQRELTGFPAGGTFSVVGGPGYVSGNVLKASGTGYIELEYHYTDGCENRAYQSIGVDDYPVPDPGPDQELCFIFNTRMQASLMPLETGQWSLIAGSGRIRSPYSPVTVINDLSVGENIYRWTVQNRSCIADAEIKIIVTDLFVPSVITPNEDGKNDFFSINEVEGAVELIIFNRWGLEEYRNTNYRNNWDGRNKNGMMLPNDTYFYILRFRNGHTRQGTVLIKR